MRRLFLLIIGFIALTGLSVWLSQSPGHMALDWGGYRIETSGVFFALALVLLFILAILTDRLLVFLFGLPRHWRQWHDYRRQQRGFKALWRSLTAAASGDAPTTETQALLAKRLLKDAPLATLLAARAARLKGDDDMARTHYTALSEHPESRLIGLQGLATLAEQQNDQVGTRRHLEQANHLEPKAVWVTEGLLHLATREEDWPQVITLLERARKAGTLSPETLKYRLATAWTGQAGKHHLEGDKTAALAAARKAHKIDPGFAPAAGILARLLIEEKAQHQAHRVIKKAWKIKPHPLLTAMYQRLIGEDSPSLRYRKITRLAACHPEDRESHIAQARSALDAELWDEAQAHLSKLPQDSPTRALCLMMAQIAQYGDNNEALARKWQQRGASAPLTDYVWICEECSHQSEEWAPLCPHCRSFASLRWQKPSHRARAPLIAPVSMDILSREESLIKQAK